MALRDELVVQGNWLFKWRSYLPLLILPLLIVALQSSGGIERIAGKTADAAWEVLCLLLSFSGLIVRSITIGYTPKGTSGRNTKKQLASVLNTTGMYSVVRHPLYLGNWLVFAGLVLFLQVWWFFLVAALAFWLYYERIVMAEEAFLEAKFGPPYSLWASQTPGFLPRFRGWRKPDLPFSFKNVLKREFHGLFLITTSFAVLDYAEDLLTEARKGLEFGWTLVFLTGLVVYLTLVALKKKTRILDVAGR